MVSRRKARAFLLQVLYANIYTERGDFQYIQDMFADTSRYQQMDLKYFENIYTTIHQESPILLGMIAHIAPKFEIATMPKVHVIILLIALAEIFFWQEQDIDIRVSTNEAIELAKKFSDTQGAVFVSGVLSSFFEKKEDIREQSTPYTALFFYTSSLLS